MEPMTIHPHVPRELREQIQALQDKVKALVGKARALITERFG
jgi:hypothetical protein